MLSGAAAPASHSEVSSVMATCALRMWKGVESRKGKTAPGARPPSSALSERYGRLDGGALWAAPAESKERTAVAARESWRARRRWCMGSPFGGDGSGHSLPSLSDAENSPKRARLVVLLES